MIKVSVIVPVYNSEKYLKTCIDSLLNQTFEDIEIILINDESTDNSLDILLDYEWNYPNKIKVIDGSHKGAGHARNIGIDLAQGEYIMFVDSDDFIQKDTIKKAYECAVSTNADIVRYDFNRVFNNKKFSSMILYPNLKENTKNIHKLEDNYLLRENLGPCNKLFSRKIIGDSRFPEDILFEDAPFVLEKIIKADKIVHLNDSLYNYTFNPNSIMGKNLFHKNEKILDILKSMDMIDDSSKELSEYINSIKLINCIHIFNDTILWKELSIEEKRNLYTYLIELVKMKYGNLEDNYGYNYVKENDSFFRKRMQIMMRYFIKDNLVTEKDENKVYLYVNDILKN